MEQEVAGFPDQIKKLEREIMMKDKEVRCLIRLWFNDFNQLRGDSDTQMDISLNCQRVSNAHLLFNCAQVRGLLITDSVFSPDAKSFTLRGSSSPVSLPILQGNTRRKALYEIYNIYILLHRSPSKIHKEFVFSNLSGFLIESRDCSLCFP